MKRQAIPTWVRAVAWLALATAPVFVALGVARSKPEWAWGGAALAVYGLVVLRRSRQPFVGRSSSSDPA